MSPANTKLTNRAARVVWVAVALLALVPTVVSWVVYFNMLRTVCDTCPLTPAYVQILESSGVPVGLWVAWMLAIPVLTAVGWSGVGLFIFVRKASDHRALLISMLLVLVTPGFGGVPFPLIDARPEWWLIQRGFVLVGMLSFLALTCLFPNGRLAPRWSLWLLLYLGALLVPNAFFVNSRLNFATWPEWLRLLLFFTPFIATFVGVPAYRYLRVLTPTERQQTKWAVLGFVVAAVGIMFTISITGRCVGSPSLENWLYCEVSQGLGYSLSLLLIPLFIGIAILRSRLWDIDVIIRRTLIYGTLTAILALVYWGGVVVLQMLLRPLVGIESELAIVASTLAIYALFQPFRRRIQAFIDRRFYRRKYDAAQVLAAFAATARDEVDLDRLTNELVGVIEETLQPEHVSLWLREPPVPAQGPRGEEQSV